MPAGLSPSQKRALLERLLRERAATGGTIRGPLSYGQRALWFLKQLDPGTAAYNLSFAARVHGRVDAPALRRALQALVDRHDSLRTTFAAADGIPYQEVQPRAVAHFDVQDGAAWSEEQLRRRCRDDVRAPFDLERGPLLRAFLYHLAQGEAALLLVAHHLIGDFWSLVLILEELGTLYRAEVEQRPAHLPRPAARYSEFVRWQAEMLAGEAGRRAEEYWRREVSRAVPELSLPTDRPRPPVQTDNGAVHSFRVSAELTSQLKQLARAEGATLFMVLVAAYQLLLSRHAGQEEFLVASPVAGRSRPAFASVVGFFVNMLLLRADLTGQPSFRTLLARVRDTVVGALEHQDYPFARLVERLAPARSSARAPFLQATLVLQRSQGGADARPLYAVTQAETRLEVGGLQLESLGIDSEATQFDLTLFAEEVDGGLVSSLAYKTDLFDPARIERMVGHFVTLLQGIVAGPDRPAAEIPMLTDGEQCRIEAWSGGPPAALSPQPVHRSFEAQAREAPDAVAVRFEGRSLTYAELNRRANRVAHALRERGVGRDVLVGLRLERSLELVVAILGVLKAGGAYLPLDTRGPAERLALVLRLARPRLLLTAGEVDEDAPLPCLDVRRLWERAAGGDDHTDAPDGEALAYVLFTSGSTGEPKGVMVPHRALRNHMDWMRRRFPLDRSDGVLQKTPVGFDASVWEFFAPLMQGARLVMARPGGHEDMAYLARVTVEEQVTTLQMVPSLLRLLVEEDAFSGCRSLRRVFCGGESLDRDLARSFHARSQADLVNLYGPTEACIDATFWPVDPAGPAVCIGRPIDNVRCLVLDPHRRPVPVGVAGELYIGGLALARGYLHRPDLDAERFVAVPGEARVYRTGDLVQWREGGDLEYLGRTDRQVKLRGLRVELDEIELHLRRHPGVRQAAVVCEARAGGQRLVAYLAGEGAGSVAVDDLRHALRRRLPEYMVPAAFVFLERLPLTSSGKLDLQALPVPRLEHHDGAVPPRNPVEAVLAEIWADVLGVERVGVHDNFFELGGDSLRGLQLVSRARRSGLSLGLEELLRLQTVAEQAEAAARATPGTHAAARRSPHGASPVPLQPLGDPPGVFFVHAVEGSVEAFAALARLVGTARPLFGLEAPELREPDREIAAATVQELASAHLEAVLRAQPQGPYHLAGWSMGGAVAYEMAHQLQRGGRSVGWLGLLDQGPRPREWGPGPGAARWPGLLAGLAELLDEAAAGGGEPAGLLEDPRLPARLSAYPDPARARRLLELALRNEAALRSYQPPVTGLRVWLFRAAGSMDPAGDPVLGWPAIAGGGVDLAVVPGDHFTMLRFPHVRALAERLTAALAAAAPQADAAPGGNP